MSVARPESDPIIIYRVADVRRILGIGTNNAYALVKKIGRRIGRRLIVAKPVLERWLAETDEEVPPPRRERRRKRSK
jgi:hypothetical protein